MTHALCLVSFVTALLVANVDAHAARAGRAAPPKRATTMRATKAKARPPSAAKAANGSRQKEVKAAYKELFDEAFDGHAAAMYVIPLAGIKETQTKAQGAYGSNQSQEVTVTGLGATGIYRADFLGSVSTHNEGARFVGDKPGMKKFIDARVAGDGVKIIHIAPSGARRELVANHPSDIVTQLRLEVKLAPGRNVIRYERTNRKTGAIVSAQGLYSEWREKVIVWDGR